MPGGDVRNRGATFVAWRAPIEGARPTVQCSGGDMYLLIKVMMVGVQLVFKKTSIYAG